MIKIGILMCFQMKRSPHFIGENMAKIKPWAFNIDN